MAAILIVDDSPSMRRMVSFTLKEAGHQVSEAEDGRGALDAAAQVAVDLVVSDMNMPGMSGIELVGALRELPAFGRKPILMLTTETSDEAKRQAQAAGADGWIIKPFNPERLVAVVDKVLGRLAVMSPRQDKGER
jgi:two-component system chemotaxis response regulator CheY